MLTITQYGNCFQFGLMKQCLILVTQMVNPQGQWFHMVSPEGLGLSWSVLKAVWSQMVSQHTTLCDTPTDLIIFHIFPAAAHLTQPHKHTQQITIF